MEAALIIPVFIAGILTFLAPCTLPLVPGYLGLISGVPVTELGSQREPAHEHLRARIFINGVFFVLGFSIVFVIFGSLIGFVGAAFTPYRVWLIRIAGLFVVLFGLFMIGIIKIPFLNKELHIKPPKVFKQGNPLNTFLIGSAFALGWTPCVGPALGAALAFAASGQTVFQGAFLLAIFSVGMAIPFLLLAALAGRSLKFVNQFSKYARIVSIIGGIILVGFGLLLLFNRTELLIEWGFRFFRFLEYERIRELL